jgi:competence protein ComGD
MKHKEGGFTLLEMMLVLTVFMVCLGAALIPLLNITDEVNDQQFFNQLERDLFEAQSYALLNNVHVNVQFYESGQHKYIISTYEFNRHILAERNIPAHFIPVRGSMMDIMFQKSGMTNRFGTVYFKSEEKRVRLIFLIGRGRFYFLEE